MALQLPDKAIKMPFVGTVDMALCMTMGSVPARQHQQPPWVEARVIAFALASPGL